MKVEIYVDNKVYAARSMELVPVAGDLIQLGIDLYKINMVVWCEPDNDDQVNLFTTAYKNK